MCRPIFIAATRQNVGKTTVSLALMSGLLKRFGKVGFIKPVGQHHVAVAGADGTELRVDKDVVVMKEFFGLDHLPYEHMSPVIIPKGYTKLYIDGAVDRQSQVDRIRESFRQISQTSQITLIEGTGHVGVGSVIEMSNAQTAALLGADIVLVANGGIGSAFDELEANRALCEAHGARIRGVIVNKVQPEKKEMVRDYFGRLIEKRWRVPLLGVIDFLPLLSKPSLADIESVLNAKLISGDHCRDLNYSMDEVEVVTTAPRRFLRKMMSMYRAGIRRPIFITHCTRDDIVMAFLTFYNNYNKARAFPFEPKEGEQPGLAGEGSLGPWQGSLVLCTGDLGRPACATNDDSTPMPYLLELTESYDAPVMLTSLGTVAGYKAVQSCSAKLNANDSARVAAAVAHYEPRIDFDKLLAVGR